MGYRATHDLVVKTGTYTSSGGEEKNRYENVGTVLTDSEDPTRQVLILKRTFNPAGVPVEDSTKDSIFISMFAKQDSNSQQSGQQSGRQSQQSQQSQQSGQQSQQSGQGKPNHSDDLGDDMPF